MRRPFLRLRVLAAVSAACLALALPARAQRDTEHDSQHDTQRESQHDTQRAPQHDTQRAPQHDAQRAPQHDAQRAPQRDSPRDFHGRDYGHFDGPERDLWRGGAWRHEWHDGRFAWWWVLGDSWYFYPAPVYPYPTYVPPAIVVQQPPPMPTGLPPAQFWYFCDNPQGYYPYVASCTTPWRQVPATPTQ